MSENHSSSSNVIPSTSRIEVVIVVLTLLIRLGKYLPWIVLAFAGLNMALVILYFTRWNSMPGGILNLILAVAGFLFFAQLIRRRTIHRENYQSTRTLRSGETKNAANERRVGAEVR
jgi:uncharacterized integral membrane protein